VHLLLLDCNSSLHKDFPILPFLSSSIDPHFCVCVCLSVHRLSLECVLCSSRGSSLARSADISLCSRSQVPIGPFSSDPISFRILSSTSSFTSVGRTIQTRLLALSFPTRELRQTCKLSSASSAFQSSSKSKVVPWSQAVHPTNRGAQRRCSQPDQAKQTAEQHSSTLLLSWVIARSHDRDE
jgi:hypothetical protein